MHPTADVCYTTEGRLRRPMIPDRLTSVPITDTTAIRSTVIEVCGGGFNVEFQSRQIATGEPRRQHAVESILAWRARSSMASRTPGRLCEEDYTF